MTWTHKVLDSASLNDAINEAPLVAPVSTRQHPNQTGSPAAIATPVCLPAHELVLKARRARSASQEKPVISTGHALWCGISNACMDDVPEQVFYGAPEELGSATARQVDGDNATLERVPSPSAMLPSYELVRQARARATSQEPNATPMADVSWTGISGACSDQADLWMVYETPRRASHGAPAADPDDEVAPSMPPRMVTPKLPSHRAPVGLRKSSVDQVLQPSPSLQQPRLWSGLHNESSSQDVNCMPSPSPPARRRSSRASATSLGQASATASTDKENEGRDVTKTVCFGGATGLASLSPLSFTLAFH